MGIIAGKANLIYLRQVTTIFFLLTLITLVSESIAAQEIKNIRIWKSPEKTRVVVDLSKKAQYTFFQLDKPNRAVIDIKIPKQHGSLKNFRAKSQKLDLSASVIKKIRSSHNKPNVYRIVLELNETIRPQHFQLPPEKPYSHRLVVDLSRDQKNTTDPILAMVKKKNLEKQINNAEPKPALNPSINTTVRPITFKEQRDIVIAIDAGHGGQDPGALGHKGSREKDIVLNVAKRMKYLIDKEKGLRSVLIRTGDYYIGLKERRKIAIEKYNADFFISLHADAWRKKSARGASVFVLSSNGASSTRARYLAEKENAADLLGSTSETQDNPVLKKVLVDLSLNGSIEHSVNAGSLVLGELGKVTKLHKPRIEKAGFAVLKNAEMPSLLVELGFITNPKEERLLKNTQHQNKLAKAMIKGIKRHFLNQPPPDTYFASLRHSDKRQHQIARGETLSEIAEKYRVAQKDLKEINDLNSDLIRIGQVLRIPSLNSCQPEIPC